MVLLITVDGKHCFAAFNSIQKQSLKKTLSYKKLSDFNFIVFTACMKQLHLIQN